MEKIIIKYTITQPQLGNPHFKRNVLQYDMVN